MLYAIKVSLIICVPVSRLLAVETGLSYTQNAKWRKLLPFIGFSIVNICEIVKVYCNEQVNICTVKVQIFIRNRLGSQL